MKQQLEERFRAACRSLVKDINRGFDSGAELIGIIELRNGNTAQVHVSLVSDENEFLDCDGPTGCADDLIITDADLREMI